MLIQLTILLLSTTSAIGSPTGWRIVNGTDANIEDFPFVASLRFLDSHSCGATILNNNFILTAAHCVYRYPTSLLSLQSGLTTISSGFNAPNVARVSKIMVHENYTGGGGYYYDVAVVKLDTKLTYGPTVQPVVLAPAGNATPENAPATLIGWGLDKSGGSIQTHLQQVNIVVYSDDECEKIHAQTGPTNRKFNICAGVPEGGKGQCNGDSGGPLLVNGVQVGGVSWSIKPCTVKGYPGVFSKTATYVDWIYKQVADNS
ncbi:trypsin-like [Zophobas morio]|uniref:trypsin-like n=1 Tax=Zophobas morio TaxID=2755281 RepID=UPI0030836300